MGTKITASGEQKFRLRWLPEDDTIFRNVLRSSSDPWSNNEIPVLIVGAGFLLERNPVIFRSCWRRGGFLN